MRRSLALIALLAAACSPSEGTLRASGAWVRSMPPGATSTAAYFTLENSGREVRVLSGVSSREFARAELHETRMEDGMARMRALERLEIPPGGRVELAPGGLHLMLREALHPPAPGAAVTLRLQFADGGLVEIEATVRDP